MVDLPTFCKKKGFMYPSSEIYGGISGLYDYGHLGTKLKHNFENLWRNYFLHLHPNFHEIEAAEIMHGHVFKASGHLEHFIDPIAKCSKCGHSERADHLVETAINTRAEDLTPEELTKLLQRNKIKCGKCKGNFNDVEVENMMFPVKIGVGKQQQAYLRPETAQSPYVNFKHQFELLRKKLPLGLALIGRAYRNEISPRHFTLRQRAFTQAELQIFFNPDHIKKHEHFNDVKKEKLYVVLTKDRKKTKTITAANLVKEGIPAFYVYHLVKVQQFYFNVLKIPPHQFRLYQLNDKEKAFYNKYHFDIEIKLTDHGWTEVGGVHYRTDHDLLGHQTISKQKMEVFDEVSGKKFIPHVLELSFGVDRHIYALIDLNHVDDKKRGNIVLQLPKKLTPFFCAVFPLVKNKKTVVKKAHEVHNLINNWYSCFYDETSAVGRRYARADEAGVKYCITVDFDSVEDNAVTIRDRDTTKQERVPIKDLKDKLFTLYCQ
jgi:glycyl-tRNA synthetase